MATPAEPQPAEPAKPFANIEGLTPQQMHDQAVQCINKGDFDAATALATTGLLAAALQAQTGTGAGA